MRISTHFFGGACLAVVVSLVPRASSARGFEAAGELRLAYIHAHRPDATAKFTIRVQDCQWLIQITDDSNASWFDYRSVGYDGTGIYELDAYNSAATEQQLQEHPLPSTPATPPRGADFAAGIHHPTGYIHSGDVPGYYPFYANQLWFGLASGCYLKALSTDRVDCVVLRPQFPPGCTVKAGWDEDPQDPYFIRRAVLYNEGTIEFLDGRTMAAPPPYDHGYSNYVYTVLEDAHIGGTKLPIRFQMEDFAPAPHAQSASDRTPLWRLTGTITSYGPVASGQSCLPPITQRTRIQDFRSPGLSNAEFVSYQSRTGWLRLDSPEFKSLQTGIPYKPKERSIKTVVRILLVALLIICPIIVWKAKTKQPSTKGRI